MDDAQLLKVHHVVLDNAKPREYPIYTRRNGNGEYALDHSGAVFFTTIFSDTFPAIDGKPHSTEVETIFLYRVAQRYGFYDANFENVSGKFNTWRDALDWFVELEPNKYKWSEARHIERVLKQ